MPVSKKLLAFLLCSTLLLGDSSGPLSGTASSGSGWTNRANVGASDNAYATYSIPVDSTQTTALYISSLGFAIPASATVTGIEATFEHKCSGSNSCITTSIYLTKTAGTSQGDNKRTLTYWGTTDATETLGSSTDLWGSTWTVSEVNAAGFGLVTVIQNDSETGSRTASIDYMAVTVYYSGSGTGSHRRVVISQTRSVNLAAQGT